MPEETKPGDVVRPSGPPVNPFPPPGSQPCIEEPPVDPKPVDEPQDDDL